MRRATVPPPENHCPEPEAVRNCGKASRMPERIGTVEDIGRRGAECSQHASAGEEVPDETLARGNQRIGEHIPRTGLDRALSQRAGNVSRSFGSEFEVVLEDDGLPIEQKGAPRYTLEHFVDQRDKPAAELGEGPVPFPIPVSVDQKPDRQEPGLGEPKLGAPRLGEPRLGVLFRPPGRHTAESAGTTSRLQASTRCALPSAHCSCPTCSIGSNAFATCRRWSRQPATSASSRSSSSRPVSSSGSSCPATRCS